MKISKIPAILFMFLLLSLNPVGRINAEEKNIFRVGDRKTINFWALFDDIKKTNLIFIGESHDSEFHHALQLDIIKSLHGFGIPIAVGLEMFRTEDQKSLDRWTDGKLSEEDFTRLYYKSWNVPLPLYRDIFLYMRENKIPAAGLNIPTEISRKVAGSGFSSLSQEELEKLPPGISCTVDEKYMEFIKRAYSSHSYVSKEFVHFCEAQMVWDYSMAWYLNEFLKNNPGRIIVVLAGVGHSWKKGIPGQLKALSGKISYRVLLPQVTNRIEPGNITVEDADYILLN